MPIDGRERSTKREGLNQFSSKKFGRKPRKTRFASQLETIEYPNKDDPWGEEPTVGKKTKNYSKAAGSRTEISATDVLQFLKRPGGRPPKPPVVVPFKESAERMKAAFKKTLEEVREDFKKTEPISVIEANPREIKLKDIKATLNLSGLKMSGLHEFIINKLEVPTPEQLKDWDVWLKYEIAVPHLHISGKYEVEGVHKKTDVRSVGEFNGDILFYTNTGHVTFMIDEDGALQVDTYKLKLKSLGVDIQEKGLQFGILGSSELKAILDKELHLYLQKYWKEIAPKVALKAKEKLNAVLRRIFKERQEATIANKETKRATDEARRIREEEMRKCRERIANRPDRRPPGYPLSRDQSLLGWLHPPKHPMM